jgi:hypothetical protein
LELFGTERNWLELHVVSSSNLEYVVDIWHVQWGHGRCPSCNCPRRAAR